MVRHSSEFEPGDWSDPRLRPPVTDDLPRWLVVGGAIAGGAIVVALLRYAVDLLGLVSITVLVGFSIRTVTDWLTDGEAVSGWSLAAVAAGAAGTAAAGLWLFGSADVDRMRRVSDQLPPGFVRAIEWAEEQGWGGRVLLPDDRAASSRTGRPPVGGAPGRAVAPVAGAFLGGTGRTPQEPPQEQQQARSTAAMPASKRPAAGEDSYATQTALTASPAPSILASPVRLTATVSAGRGAPLPEGTVVFRRGTAIIGSARLGHEKSGAVARLSTTSLPLGTHELVAEYVGGGAFATSRSAVVLHTVVKTEP
ncbi:MAG TPA: Ig-like domain-containing protein [Vicinamibacterales bacterium]|nr:Ig-like domain-containing protein [Vicinamibacterales bacterium]